MFALIGTVAAQEFADLPVTADAPAVLHIEWQNPRDLGWVFGIDEWTACTKSGDVCYFNDGQATYAADLYLDSNQDGDWNVTFDGLGEVGVDEGFLHRTLGHFTPERPLEMTRHTAGNYSGGADDYADFTTKIWQFNTIDDTGDCSIDADQGGACTVPIELRQGIDEAEVTPGLGRLKQGTYENTITATLIP